MRPYFAPSAIVASNFVAVLLAATISAPVLGKVRAIALPIPRPDPVIKATLLLRLNFFRITTPLLINDQHQ